MNTKNIFDSFSRRNLLASAAATTAVSLATGSGIKQICLAEDSSAKKRSQILKTLKIDMVRVEGSLETKFKAIKAAGFQGVELNAPGFDVKETRAAIESSGLVVDGTVCGTHWQVRHSSPDAKVRDKALGDLKKGIEQTHAVGGNTILLVVGHGDDGPESDIIPRSIENIAQALPLAAELGVYIAIENVWNKFLYDHNGPSNQSADRFVKYVDQLDSPWVGMQFDIGNHWKYGDPAEWIRTLGKRVVKLDIKGYSRQKQTFTAITECDINWPSVRKALDDIGFHGWCAAEVSGGDQAALTKIAKEMDTVLELA